LKYTTPFNFTAKVFVLLHAKLRRQNYVSPNRPMLPGYLNATSSSTQTTHSFLLIHKSFNIFLLNAKFCSLFNGDVGGSVHYTAKRYDN